MSLGRPSDMAARIQEVLKEQKYCKAPKSPPELTKSASAVQCDNEEGEEENKERDEVVDEIQLLSLRSPMTIKER